MIKVLTFENVSYSPWKNDFWGKTVNKTLLKEITFSLDKGKVLGIAGISGSGKSTLARLIAGLIRPVSGKIYFSPETKNIRLLSQNNYYSINPLRKISSILLETASVYRTDHLLQAVLDEVNFPADLLNRRGGELSGGERQRAALAQILLSDPHLIVFDEPFSAQDPASAENFSILINRLQTEKKLTTICISHDLNILFPISDEMMILHKGKIIDMGKSGDLRQSPSHPLTEMLQKALIYDLGQDDLENLPYI